MSAMNDYESYDYSIGNGYSSVFPETYETRSGTRTYLEGNVVTPHGIVDVYSDSKDTMMSFVFGGRNYRRRWNCGFTKRTLSTLAKRFAKEIAGAS